MFTAVVVVDAEGRPATVDLLLGLAAAEAVLIMLCSNRSSPSTVASSCSSSELQVDGSSLVPLCLNSRVFDGEARIFDGDKVDGEHTPPGREGSLGRLGFRLEDAVAVAATLLLALFLGEGEAAAALLRLAVDFEGVVLACPWPCLPIACAVTLRVMVV